MTRCSLLWQSLNQEEKAKFTEVFSGGEGGVGVEGMEFEVRRDEWRLYLKERKKGHDYA